MTFFINHFRTHVSLYNYITLMIHKMNRPFHLSLIILKDQNQQFSCFLIDQEEYSLVLNLYIQFYYDANVIKLNIFIKNKFLHHFQISSLFILNV